MTEEASEQEMEGVAKTTWTQEEINELQDGLAKVEEQKEKTDIVPQESGMFHVEEFTGILKEFIIRMGERGNEQAFVKRAGLLFKAEKKGMRAMQVEVQEENGGFLAKATLYPTITKMELEMVRAAQGLDTEVQKGLLENLMKPFIDFGTATPENVKMKTMHPYMRELAITRASNRVLRAFTACGFTSVEELSDYEGREE